MLLSSGPGHAESLVLLAGGLKVMGLSQMPPWKEIARFLCISVDMMTFRSASSEEY